MLMPSTPSTATAIAAAAVAAAAIAAAAVVAADGAVTTAVPMPLVLSLRMPASHMRAAVLLL